MKIKLAIVFFVLIGQVFKVVSTDDDLDKLFQQLADELLESQKNNVNISSSREDLPTTNEMKPTETSTFTARTVPENARDSFKTQERLSTSTAAIYQYTVISNEMTAKNHDNVITPTTKSTKSKKPTRSRKPKKRDPSTDNLIEANEYTITTKDTYEVFSMSSVITTLGTTNPVSLAVKKTLKTAETNFKTEETTIIATPKRSKNKTTNHRKANSLITIPKYGQHLQESSNIRNDPREKDSAPTSRPIYSTSSESVFKTSLTKKSEKSPVNETEEHDDSGSNTCEPSAFILATVIYIFLNPTINNIQPN